MRNYSLEKRLENLKLSNEESKRLTRESIQTALINLMATTSYDKISITDLVKKSGVSRAAFYRNYKNKEDVLKDFSQNIIKLVVVTLKDESTKENLSEWFLKFFNVIKMNRKTIDLIFKAKINIYDYLIENKDIISVEYSKLDEYKIVALMAGMISISIKWYKNNFKETPEEMAELTYNLYTDIKSLF